MGTYISRQNLRGIVICIIVFLCLFPFFTPPMALASGIILSLIPGERTKIEKSKISKILLQSSVVLMGFGMSVSELAASNKEGLKITVFSVAFTIICGVLLGKLLKTDKKTSYLIACGTAICGGSAIAAVAPVIKAKGSQMSFALAIVFTLNAIALFVFPCLGHLFDMSQTDFGYWAAIAIHDTSSVVGAGSQYGPVALKVATTVKLTRALWVIPVAIFTSLMYKTEGKRRISIPWFILFFVVAVALKHFVLQFADNDITTGLFEQLNWLGKKGLVMSLLFIGISVSVSDFKKAGKRLLILGVSLWFIISVVAYLWVS